jgi:hypothetical protein
MEACHEAFLVSALVTRASFMVPTLILVVIWGKRERQGAPHTRKEGR